jgi:hypothetical protein
MQKDKLAAMNIWRGGIAEMEGKKRPYDFHNAESSGYGQPRPAEGKPEGKTLCHYTDPGLQFARGGQSSFCVHGRANFMGQDPVAEAFMHRCTSKT